MAMESKNAAANITIENANQRESENSECLNLIPMILNNNNKSAQQQLSATREERKKQQPTANINKNTTEASAHTHKKEDITFEIRINTLLYSTLLFSGLAHRILYRFEHHLLMCDHTHCYLQTLYSNINEHTTSHHITSFLFLFGSTVFLCSCFVGALDCLTFSHFIEQQHIQRQHVSQLSIYLLFALNIHQIKKQQQMSYISCRMDFERRNIVKKGFSFHVRAMLYTISEVGKFFIFTDGNNGSLYIHMNNSELNFFFSTNLNEFIFTIS